MPFRFRPCGRALSSPPRRSIPPKGTALAAKGIKVISLPDIRWKRPDIKTINLLPNVLARQAAKEQGAYEAWLIDADGMVIEGAASNAWIVTAEKTIVTHQVDQSILRGVTRTTLLDLIAAKGFGWKSAASALKKPSTGERGLHHRRDDARHAGYRHRRRHYRGWQTGRAGDEPAGAISQFC